MFTLWSSFIVFQNLWQPRTWKLGKFSANFLPSVQQLNLDYKKIQEIDRDPFQKRRFFFNSIADAR